jgi:hypothetical protein
MCSLIASLTDRKLISIYRENITFSIERMMIKWWSKLLGICTKRDFIFLIDWHFRELLLSNISSFRSIDPCLLTDELSILNFSMKVLANWSTSTNIAKQKQLFVNNQDTYWAFVGEITPVKTQPYLYQHKQYHSTQTRKNSADRIHSIYPKHYIIQHFLWSSWIYL